MKRVFLIILLIILSIVLFGLGNETEADVGYKTYFPIVSNNYFESSFIVPQGAAWRYTNLMPDELLQMFGLNTGGYYHSGSWKEPYWNDGGMPMIRVDWEWDTTSTYREKLQYLEDRQYDGDWYLMNEPHHQEKLSSCQIAEAVHIAIYEYDIPGHMIWYNGIWPSKFSEVLSCYRSLYDGRIPDAENITVGIHGYAINEYLPDSIPNFLSDMCNVMRSHGYRHCRLALSEIAVPNAHFPTDQGAYQAQWNWLTGIESVGRGEHLPITLRSVHYFTHCPDCLQWSGYDWDNEFNSRFWTDWSTDFTYVEKTGSGKALYNYIRKIENNKDIKPLEAYP